MSPGLMWAPQLTKLLHHFNMFQLFPMYLLFMVNHLIFQFNIINDPSLAFYKGNFFVKLNADMKQVFISLQPTTSFFFFWPTPQISPAYFLAAFFGTFKKDAGLYLESLVNKKKSHGSMSFGLPDWWEGVWKLEGPPCLSGEFGGLFLRCHHYFLRSQPPVFSQTATAAFPNMVSGSQSCWSWTSCK